MNRRTILTALAMLPVLAAAKECKVEDPKDEPPNLDPGGDAPGDGGNHPDAGGRTCVIKAGPGCAK